MPVGTAFHARTSALCASLNYRDWAGFYAVSAYETHHEHEYAAIRTSAALIDVSPLFKYRLSGPDALTLVDRVITRDATKIAVGQVVYTPWCDESGAVLDDGTVARLGEHLWRWTAAEPNLRWLHQNAAGLDVRIDDVSERVAALAVQGPMARRVLEAAGATALGGLKYFRLASGTLGGVPVEITRTGYTGDLGYEIWMPWDLATAVWDAVTEASRAFAGRPAGMLALDVARIEAGLLLIDVDFFSARKALVASQRYTPFEMGLGRLVAERKAPFVGREALAAERRRGPARQVVGLKVDWPEVEALYTSAGLAPQIPAAASRVPVPVYHGAKQVGRATSTTWSPTLKSLIALATIDAPHFRAGTPLQIEVTVDAVRHRARATVVETPFFNPPRKTATEG